MNERSVPEVNPEQREITETEMEAFIDKVRAKAPFTDQAIDDFGAYQTNYEYGTSYTTISIPGVAEELSETEDDIIDDAVTVVVRDEVEINDRYVQVAIRQYIVYITDMIADYDETTRIFDAETADWVAPRYGLKDVNDVSDYHDTRQQLGLNVFTRQRFDEVCTVLDQLDFANRL